MFLQIWHMRHKGLRLPLCWLGKPQLRRQGHVTTTSWTSLTSSTNTAAYRMFVLTAHSLPGVTHLAHSLLKAVYFAVQFCELLLPGYLLHIWIHDFAHGV